MKNKVQLSSCSQSALHTDVKSSVKDFMNLWENEGMDWSSWMEACEEARKEFAKMINAEPEEISIVSSVSHAISSVLTSIDSLIGENEKQVIVSQTDFPCIGHVALSQTGSEVIFTKDYNEINASTDLITIPHVSYYDGTIADLDELVIKAQSVKSYTFVDAYQSAGQVEIDVKKTEVDFLTAGMQKYLLGTPGIAFLYVKKDIAEKLTPKVTGWFGQANPFDFDGSKVDYADGAVRFDTGTFPMLNGFTANRALKILNDIGVENIQKYLQNLSRYALEYAKENGLETVGSKDVTKKGSTTAIRIDNASVIEQELKERGVIVSARNDVIRIAPHYYNNKNDIKVAIDSIVELIKH